MKESSVAMVVTALNRSGLPANHLASCLKVKPMTKLSTVKQQSNEIKTKRQDHLCSELLNAILL